MIDSLHVEVCFQKIPVRNFIGRDNGVWSDPFPCKIDALRLPKKGSRHRSTAPLAEYDNGWNLAVRRILQWPKAALPLETRQNVITFSVTAIPAPFQSDLAKLMHRLSTPDPLADDGQNRALRPATLSQYQRQLVRFASEVVHAGLPITEIGGLEILIDPVFAERGLRQMLTRTNNQTTKMISEIAALLRNLARILNAPEHSHTINMYSGLEARSATRAFADLIDAKKGCRK